MPVYVCSYKYIYLLVHRHIHTVFFFQYKIFPFSCTRAFMIESSLYASTNGEHVGQLKKVSPKQKKLRMSPDYHFGPKLKRMFRDGPKLMAQPGFLLNKYTKAIKPWSCSQQSKSILFKADISGQKFQEFLVAVPDLKRKITPESQNSKNSKPYFHL